MALKFAINREEIVERILRGYGTVGNDIPINAVYPLFDNTIPQRTYDSERAAEYYKKSGHDGSPIVLRVSDVAFPGAVDAAQLFSKVRPKLGFRSRSSASPATGIGQKSGTNSRSVLLFGWDGRSKTYSIRRRIYRPRIGTIPISTTKSSTAS